jgi:hypothetical protein
VETNSKIRRVITSTVLVVTVVMGLAAPVFAADSTKKDSKSDTSTTATQSTPSSGLQGYSADSVLQTGTIVQLDSTKQDKVLAATQSKLNQMFGVVIDPHILPITISSAALQNEVYVATSGTYNTLVSTQNGLIQSGDYVTLSSLDGVAMKATEKEKTVFGRAGAPFDGKTDVAGQVTLKDSTGKTINVSLGIVPVAIDIKHNPNDKSTKAKVPPFLQRVGQAVAEKPVSAVRIYLSVFIAGISIIIALMTLYSGVRTSIYSIARNPLSKKTILRGLMTVVLTSIIILIIGLFTVYLLLKL